MAVITASTFDPLKRYVRVRLAQGVPIVDADWNESDDVRQFELRAFLKWGVGDGVLEGPDAFRIVGSGLADDFTISAGLVGPDPAGITDFDKALYRVGRCLVNGLDVMIGADVRFTAQPGHTAADDVPLTAHVAGTGLVYLDVWEHLVTPTDDPNLILPGLGTESCSRIKREWMVRVRAAAAVPGPGDADFNAGHAYYALASITRRTADPLIQAGDVTDLRERHLQVMPTTLIADAFGVTPGDYRRGLLRPTVSLRGAINSLLHGELPASIVAPIPSPGTGFVFSQTSPPIFTDAANGIVAVFKAAVAGTTQIYVSRLDLGAPQAGFGPPQQVTATATTSQWGRGAPVPGGDLIVVYITDTTATPRIAYKRAGLNGLGAAAEQNVASAPFHAFSLPGIAVTGNIVTFFFFAFDGANTQHFYYRRLRHTDNVWLDAAPAVVPGLATVTSAQWYTLSPDGAGGVWIAAQQPPDSMAGRFTPATAAWDNALTVGALATPTIHAASTGEVWILGKSSSPDQQIHASLFDGTNWIFNNAFLAETTAQSLLPGIFETNDGSVWFFWLEATRFIRYRRGYGVVRQLPTDGHPPLFIGGGGGPFSLNISTPQFFLPGPTGSFYAFWSSQAGAGQPAGLWYRQVLAAI